MKKMTTFLVATVVAAFTFVGCENAVDAGDDVLADKGISKKSITLYNTYGKGASGLDAVNGVGISGHIVAKDEAGKAPYENYAWGDIAYTSEDSASIDFKAINSAGRASTLTTNLTSLNGTKYAVVDSSEFASVVKSVTRFKSKLKKIADDAVDPQIQYTAATPYFVAKLGGDRGYVLAHVTAIDVDYADSSDTNTGKADIDYFYISNTDAK